MGGKIKANINKRACGILLHVTSLPGRYGIGQIGAEAFNFLGFLSNAGQTYWHFLPITPTSSIYGHSPYMSPSAFAGNPLLISIDGLVNDGLLELNELSFLSFSEYLVDFDSVEAFQLSALKKAYRRFKASPTRMGYIQEFLKTQDWAKDYCLFMALKERFGHRPWYDWPNVFASRDQSALGEAMKELEDEILFYAFTQLVFERQWYELKRRAEALNIRLFGDIPIYVSPDSADVWANQQLFDLNPKTLRPRNVAGVPPDYFSSTGQRWGNPLYCWKLGNRPNEDLYQWWKRRFLRLRSMVHVVRIDHFRAFQAYWEIPADEKTAISGRWREGPGALFFEELESAIQGLEIVAEDLGTITPEVRALKRQVGLPGMKVLQFAFDSDEKNPYLPHNFEDTNCVVFTGTHDNSTTVGWFLDPKVSNRSKDRAMRYANSDGSRIHWDFLRMAYSSVARLAIIPMQDVLGFGDDCRMNTPSTTKGNWRWRLSASFLTQDIQQDLLDEVIFYNRL